MSHQISPGGQLRQAMQATVPLQMVGAINAYCARLAVQAGFQALYLSGAGVANASLGMPDQGLITLPQVLTDVQRIRSVCDQPLLVDVDTGFESVAETVRALEQAGAAGIQIEDQIPAKRCGHLPGKQLVSCEAMVARLQEALAARQDPQFVITARTDAIAVKGITQALARAQAYCKAGADVLFVEAATRLDEYRLFAEKTGAPILANMTEFGQTPLFTLAELRQANVAIALYPLSAFRAMNLAAQQVYETIQAQGTQQAMLAHMQTRDDLYRTLNYEVDSD